MILYNIFYFHTELNVGGHQMFLLGTRLLQWTLAIMLTVVNTGAKDCFSTLDYLHPNPRTKECATATKKTLKSNTIENLFLVRRTLEALWKCASIFLLPNILYNL